MTTPPYAELVAAVRQEGSAIVAAGQQGLDAQVPTCPGWAVADLLAHVGRTYRRAAGLVSERATTKTAFPPRPEPKADLVGYVSEALDELIDALRDTEPDTPVWNFTGESGTAAWWARRMAHESAIHRFDAQKAHNLAQPVDGDLARDGIDELLDVLVPLVLAGKDDIDLPAATILLVATDEGEWPVRIEGREVSRLTVAKEPDVTARGTSSALLLAAYNRMDWTALDCSGETSVLDAWSSRVKL
jgi:uncharacterized protein (TIGR03083 family)